MEENQLPRASETRTVVLPDCHGNPAMLRAALNDLATRGEPFENERDNLVFTGDFLDRGSDPEGCLHALEEHSAVMLVGNHEQAAALGYWIREQEEASLRFKKQIQERLLSGTMRLVAAVDGVLISHAGVSCEYQRDFDVQCARDIASFAHRLCAEYIKAIGDQISSGRRADPVPRILGRYAPHRYPTYLGRPGPQQPGDSLDPPAMLIGPLQVVGHNPPEVSRAAEEYRRAGIFQIDLPYHRALEGWFRYAIIEGGLVRVEEGRMH